MKHQKGVTNWLAFGLFGLMLLVLAPGIGQAATFTVNSTADTAGLGANCASGVGICTLRSAVQQANTAAGADTIILPAGTYILTLVGAGEQAAATGDLDIIAVGGALTITGAGAATTIIDGNNTDRIFETIGAATATISGVTLRNGNPGLGASGGAIATSGGTILTLTNVVMTANTSGLEGAAIDIAANAASVATMNTVVVSNNTSAAGGDIIANGAGATLTITNGTISGNNETAISNKAGSTATLTNVTVSGNTTTGGGGAIDNLGILNLQNGTINANIGIVGAGNAGGIRNTGTVSIRNTIISNNTPTNCVPTVAFTSLGNNISSDASCGLVGAGDLSSTDPLLVPLADNGGPLQTHALTPISPAIDAGSPTVCPATDARGIARPVDGNPLPPAVTAICDIGAFEFRPRLATAAPASPFNFGTVTSGTIMDQVVTIANGGDGPLLLGAVAAADTLLAPFTIPVNNCTPNQTLARAASCTLTVRFAPISVIPASDTFNIPSDDPLTPTVTFSVSGTGTSTLVPNITVTPLPVNFGSIAIGATADATVTVGSNGVGPVVIGTIAGTDPLAAPFVIVNNTCSGQAIPPAATCTIAVRFSPTANVTSSDTFDIPNNDPDTPTFTVTLTGSGVSASGNHPPSVPVLTSPANGATMPGTSVTLAWQLSTDADGDAVAYHVTNCANAAFTGCTPVNVASAPSALLFAGMGSFGAGILLVGFVAGNGPKRSRKMVFFMIALLLTGTFFMACSSGGDGGGAAAPATKQLTVSGLAAGTPYFWKVVADDGKGGTSTSATGNYTTQ